MNNNGRPEYTEDQYRAWLGEMTPFLKLGCSLYWAMDRACLLRHKDSIYRKFRLNDWFCEERGSGIDRVIAAAEIYQLPPPEFETNDNFTKVILFAYKTFSSMSKEEKTRATYQHCVLKYVSKETMTNSSLRKRFSIGESNYPMASRIIRDTLDAKLIKPISTSSKSKRDFKYIPYWA